MTDLPIYFSSDYTLAGYSFDTTRMAALVARSLAEQPIPGVRLVEPRPLTANELAEVHDAGYVEAVRTGEPGVLAQSQGFDWDPGLSPLRLAASLARYRLNDRIVCAVAAVWREESPNDKCCGRAWVAAAAATVGYSDRLTEAMAAAAQIHGTQERKGTTIPYLSHLLGTCAIALDYGANEDEAIAALLHDAIEDGQPTTAARATVWTFGDEVGRIVEGCTDADSHPKPPWLERKEAYLAKLATEDRSVLLVSASDKLHNARSILRDLRQVGEELWARFSSSKEQTLWYYRSLVTCYRANPAHISALIDELDRTVTEIETLAKG